MENAIVMRVIAPIKNRELHIFLFVIKLESYVFGDLPLPPALFNLQHRKRKFFIKNDPSGLSNFRININYEILEQFFALKNSKSATNGYDFSQNDGQNLIIV